MDQSARILVMGLGKTGASVVRFLSARGFMPSVWDSRDCPPGLEALPKGLRAELGTPYPSVLAEATHVIVSPGLPTDTPELQAARLRGVAILGDLDLFAEEARARIVAITGANGKSTVTTLLGLMAERSGHHVRVGGNLGTPMLDLLDDTASLYVLELSSFQLERAERLRASAATVLNISPDHMDRYPTLEAYADAKARIFAGEGEQILNHDDPRVAAMAVAGRSQRWFSVREPLANGYHVAMWQGEAWLMRPEGAFMPVAALGIKGRHNQANALAAVALGDAAGLAPTAMREILASFTGLAHRMQWVATIGGIDFINDSKATNIGACEAALQGLDQPVVLIAGGDGKGADFTELEAVVRRHVRALVLVGRDAPLIEAALGTLVPIVHAGKMQDAVEKAQGLAHPGDAVLLAPACASLDQYRDYQQRGEQFAEAVRALCA